eukprot:g14158.t1
MSVRRSDAQQGDSSPESLPSGHQSRLAIPRDWRSSLNRRKSENPGGSASGSSRKEQRQAQLENDGEWYADARGSPASKAEKPEMRLGQHPEQDSPAMSLLCSITRASANAIPAIRSPRAHARLRQRDQPRPRFASVNSGGGAGSSGSAEFYRLPWYRRPLPSHRRTSVAGGEPELKRRNSMIAAPRAGLRPPRASSGAAVAPVTTVGGAAAASAAEEGVRSAGQPRQQEQQQEQTCVADAGEAQVGAGAVEADEADSETPPGVVPLRRSTSSAASSSSAFGAAADRGATPERAAATKGMSGAAAAAAAAAAPTAAEFHATPKANSMAADRDDGIMEESSGEKAGVGAAAAADAVVDEREVPRGDVDSDEVKKLRAEIHRLKREMASMAAAAAKDTTTPPVGPSKRGNAHRSSPRIEVSSPVIPPARANHSTWEWEPAATGANESFDAGNAGKSTRPTSARLRADDSWMRRRRSGEAGDGNQRVQLGSSGDWSASAGPGFGIIARAGSILPAPGSDDGARWRNRPPSDAGGGDHGLSEEGGLLLSPPATAAKVEGPSPASGEKSEEAKAAAADARRRLSSGAGSVEEGSGGSEGARSDTSMRQMSVFFPVQQQSSEPSAAQATPDSRAVAAEGAAALAHAAATQIGATASPPEAARAAQAARDAVAAKQQQAATRHVAAAPVVLAKIPVVTGASCAGGGCRWRGAGDSNGGVWRWVLAQRTGNQTVRQAVISHGLPPCGRRHIWAAWAAVATPETYSKGKAASDPAKEGSVVNVIVHDVARTKILHPLFETGGQGLGMLKRVLVRCAELGAVKEAGYIQGMNYLAGFILVTLVDCVMSEREDTPAPSSRRDPGSAGSDGTTTSGSGSSSSSPAGDSPPYDKCKGPLEQAGAAAVSDARKEGAGDAAGAGPTAAEIGAIEGECVRVMQGIIALQGGVLSRDLWGLHANTELVEDLLSKNCPDVMDHLRMVHLELIVLTPRWFICIYAGSMTSQAVVTRIWDLFMWYGRRGPAVLVWVALGILHGCRRRMFESKSLPATVKAVRRHAEGCKTFDDLVRQAPVGLNQVVAAWEAQGNNRRIAALDGDGAVPDRMAAGLVGEMTGEPVPIQPQEALSPPRHHRRSQSGVTPVGTASTTFGIQFPSTPGRSPTPLTSPRSPFPEWAANIFRSSTGGGGFENGEGGGASSSYVDQRGDRGGGGVVDSLPPMSPRFSTPSKSRPLRRSASNSWW